MINLKKYQIQDESLDNEEEEPTEMFVEPTKTELVKDSYLQNKNPNNSVRNAKIENNTSLRLNNKSEIPHFAEAEVGEADWEDQSLMTNMYNNPTNKNNLDIPIQNNQEIFASNISHIESNVVDINNPNYGNTKSNKHVANNKEGYHHMQIIDEDVENFKRRLDVMIKNFRTDTLKDFMGIKRHLLLEQKSIIDSERQKCEALLAAKTDQIEHLKENLSKAKMAINYENEIKEKMGTYLFKIKNSKYLTHLKTKVLITGLKRYYLRQKKNKKILEKLRKKIIAKNKLKIFNMLKLNLKEMKTIKTINNKEKEFQDKLNEMSQYYGKEINDLRAKLQDAYSTIEKYKESKNILQENLKKALMRGVVAMNLEAMNVLEGDGINSSNLRLVENLMGNLNLSNTSIPNSANNNRINESSNTTGKNDENNSNNINTTNKNTYTPNTLNILTENLENNRKNVVKDSNWVNACSVPAKMKSNIISTENEIDNEFEESFRVKSNRNPNPTQKNKFHENSGGLTSNQLLFANVPSQSVHDELSKNLNNIRSEFQILKNNTAYDNNRNIINSNVNESDSYEYEEESHYSFNKNYNENLNVLYNPNGKPELGNMQNKPSGVNVYANKNLIYKMDQRENIFANNLNTVNNPYKDDIHPVKQNLKKHPQTITEINNTNKNSLINFNNPTISHNTETPSANINFNSPSANNIQQSSIGNKLKNTANEMKRKSSSSNFASNNQYTSNSSKRVIYK